MENTTIESTVNRKHAWIIVFATVFFGGIFLTQPRLALFHYLILAICVLFFLVFFSALVFPKRFRRGVRLFEGGFEYISPIGGSRTIHFNDIIQIIALCRGEGDTGDCVPLQIQTRTQKVLIPEYDLYATKLIDRLKLIQGFDTEVYFDSIKYEVSGLELIFGKKYTVYELIKQNQ